MATPGDAGPGGRAEERPVVIVGAGPVGLALAIDLRLHGIEPLVLEADASVSTGSRAICYAKRSLEIMARLGVGQRMLDKGVTWKLGKVFWRDRLVYQFDLLPEAGHRMPAFVNCQQYYLEQFLVERARELGIEIRWAHPVSGALPRPDGARVLVQGPAGAYAIECEWLLACDGARSTVRHALGLAFEGQVFRDRFLITDVKMEADFPPERWFWFDPPFHEGQSALLHSQPDHVWRIDLQLGWDADPAEEVKPERVIPRLEAMLGPERPFEIEWTSIYTFRCRRLEHFRHGRVLFLGDAAHQVSPFGARGFNGGLQDADNLAWKLALVLAGDAPEGLLESFCAEREPAADENIRHSTRSTEFITPKTEASRALRDAVLQLAADHPFARRLINSGRLSTPHMLHESCLNTPDEDAFVGGLRPGSPCLDAPLSGRNGPCWLLDQLGGGFTLLVFRGTGERSPPDPAPALRALRDEPIPVEPRIVTLGQSAGAAGGFADLQGLAAKRYDARPGTTYLVRPDQHVAARWRRLDPDRVRTALRRCVEQGVSAPALSTVEA